MKIKKLNFVEMWQLYLLLSPFLPKVHSELLIDEIYNIVTSLDPTVYMRILRMFCEETESDPAEGLLILIRGLKENNFFYFLDFVEGLK